MLSFSVGASLGFASLRGRFAALQQGVSELGELRPQAAVEDDIRRPRATAPPISDGSTATSSSTRRPVRAASARSSRSRCSLASGAAEVTRALTPTRRRVGELLELGADRVEVDEAPLVDEEGQEVPDHGVEPEALADGAQHRAALGHWMQRPEQRARAGPAPT